MFTAALLTAAALVFPQGVSAQEVPLDPPVTVQSSFALDGLCTGNKIAFSPTGRYFASWSHTQPDMVIFPSDCLLDGLACSGWKLRSISRFAALLWTDDDVAYLAPGDGRVRRFRPATGELRVDSETPLRRLPNNVGTAGLINPTGPTWNESVGALAADYTIIGVASRTDGFEHAFLDRQTHHVILNTAQGWIETDISARWSGTITPIRDTGGRLFLIGPGLVHRFEAGAATPAFPDLYQPRPVLDASTGLVAGAFDDGSIRLLDEPVLNSGSPPHALPPGLDFIEDAATASNGGLTAFKVKMLDGSGAISIVETTGRSWNLQCTAPVRNTASAEAPVATMAIEDWGRPGRPLMVRRRVLIGPDHGTVVLWPGGPGGTFAAGGSRGHELAWLKRGFSVVTIDGSGSQGLELGRRLRDDGFPSILLDAEDVAARLSGSEFDDLRIVVTGGSFGGAAAAETARRLASLTADRPPPELLLIAPWLRYRHPAGYNVGEGRERTDQTFLERSDEAAFGPVDKVARDMESWRSSFSYDGRVLALFGAADLIVRPEDIWPSTQNTSTLTVEIIPGADHRFISAVPATDAAIDAWLAVSTI